MNNYDQCVVAILIVNNNYFGIVVGIVVIITTCSAILVSDLMDMVSLFLVKI